MTFSLNYSSASKWLQTKERERESSKDIGQQCNAASTKRNKMRNIMLRKLSLIEPYFKRLYLSMFFFFLWYLWFKLFFPIYSYPIPLVSPTRTSPYYRPITGVCNCGLSWPYINNLSLNLWYHFYLFTSETVALESCILEVLKYRLEMDLEQWNLCCRTEWHGSRNRRFRPLNSKKVLNSSRCCQFP